jgi:osmotically-inducible protein OsmY
MRGILYLTLIVTLTPALSGCVAVVVGGAATGALIADDRRKTGVYFEDQEIELRGFNRIRGDFPHASVNVSVTSFNHSVLLTGQAPDEATKSKVGEVIKGIPNVRKVYNEITISGVPSLTSAANDSALTAEVKAKLTDRKGVRFTHVKVVTESGVVYLMGLLTHAEADVAARSAATTDGVVRVVKVVEYID